MINSSSNSERNDVTTSRSHPRRDGHGRNDETTCRRQSQQVGIVAAATTKTSIQQQQHQHQTETIIQIQKVHVDIIIPVYNASSTIEDAVNSAMNQQIPPPSSTSSPVPTSSRTAIETATPKWTDGDGDGDDVGGGGGDCFGEGEGEGEGQCSPNSSNSNSDSRIGSTTVTTTTAISTAAKQQQRQQQRQRQRKQEKECKEEEDDPFECFRVPPLRCDVPDLDSHSKRKLTVKQQQLQKQALHHPKDEKEQAEQDHHYYYDLSITVCCYDDNSTDSSLEILQNLVQQQQQQPQNGKHGGDEDDDDQKMTRMDYDTNNASIIPTDEHSSSTTIPHHHHHHRIPSRLLVESSSTSKSISTSRGAGYARNRAIEMNDCIRRSRQFRSSSDRANTNAITAIGGGNNNINYADIATSTVRIEPSGRTQQQQQQHSQQQVQQEEGEMDFNSNDDDDDEKSCLRFLCWLDSDDIMHPYRVAYQTLHMLKLKWKEEEDDGEHQQQQLRQQQQQRQRQELNDSSKDDVDSSSSSSSIARSRSSFSSSLMDRTLLGTTFVRDPPDSTWHYTDWANNKLLVRPKDNHNQNHNTFSRLMLERFREITVIQPTWFMTRKRWNEIGPYVEAPPQSPPRSSAVTTTVQSSPSSQQQYSLTTVQDVVDKYYSEHGHKPGSYCLVHPTFETSPGETLKLAEDLRLFYSHLKYHGTVDIVTHKRRHRHQYRHPRRVDDDETTDRKGEGDDSEDTTDDHHIHSSFLQSPEPLVTYRQLSPNGSQSFRTSRRLILALRCQAFQDLVLRPDNTDWWNGDSLQSSSSSSSLVLPAADPHHRQQQDQKFVIWGAGRDGKEFFKMLDETNKKKVYCFVDVDPKKLQSGYYVDHYTSNSTDKTKSNSDKNQKKRKITTHKQKKKRNGHTYKIPIVHFSYLAPNNERQRLQEELLNDRALVGQINKSKHSEADKEHTSTSYLRNTAAFLNDRNLDLELLQIVPVVVCVAMYRTNGVLEYNVSTISRIEGRNLWHFS